MARLASRQYGVVALDQAREWMSKSMIYRRTAAGEWIKVLPGVFRMAGSADTQLQRAMAAALWAGEGSVVSHGLAAALWRMAGYRTDVIELITPRKVAPRDGIRIHHLPLPPAHKTLLGPIPITTPARTLVDLAAVAPREVLEGAVDDCLRRGLVTVERLKRTAEEMSAPGRKGPGIVLALLDEGVVESALERRTLRLLRSAGFPEPERQYVIEHNGDFLARVDLAYPEAKLAMEADGYGSHSGPGAFHKDRSRLNRLTMAGWNVLLVTDETLRQRPQEIVAQVAEGLKRRNPGEKQPG